MIQTEHCSFVQASDDARTQNKKNIIDFRAGLPALDLFPRKLWGQLGLRVCAESSPSVFGYDRPEECAELRIAGQRYEVREARGMVSSYFGRALPERWFWISSNTFDRKDIAPAGAGETPIMAVAPAIGNAIFDATGQRLNNLPLIPNGLKAT